jgi:CHAD domain-containing protein
MTDLDTEIERSFSVPADQELPDLTELTGVRAVERSGTTILDAAYLDTPDLALLRAGVTLRRCTSGADDGWHLTLPVDAPGGREEVTAPLGHAAEPPPTELVDLVLGWTRGVALAAVARLETTRSTWRIVGADGRVLAELADERAVGQTTGLHAEPTRWREWEVEQVDGDPGLLDEVERLLAAAGINRSVTQQKLARVLGIPPDDDEPPEQSSKHGPAQLLLHQWLVDQVRELATCDPLARRGGQGGVHGMRKACRRLRAALATYGPMLDRERTDPVRDELRWLARSLGPARDDEVVLERLERLLDDEPGGPDVAAARHLLERYAVDRAEHGHAAVVSLLGSPRYLDLRTALDQLLAEPPWTDAADQPARTVLPPLVRKEGERVRRRYRRQEDPHEVRKAAKRLRYAYEVLEPAWGESAAGPRQVTEELTEILGDRQDSLAAREWLVELEAEARLSGDGAFTLGRLHALEQGRESDRLEEAWQVYAALESVTW